MAGIGSAPGIILGVGVGTAAGAALAPAIEVQKQQAWARAPNRILNVELVARLVAQGGVDLSSAHAEAKLDGYGPDRLDALVYLEQVAPGSGEALVLWRLGLLGTAGDPHGDDLFQHALTKAGLDPRFAAAIVARKTAERVGLGDIGYSVVRGYLPTNIKLPVAPPSTSDYVPRFPQSKTLAEDLAAEIGYDPAMLELIIARSGLSMAPVMAANALFRSDAAAAIANLPAIGGVAAYEVKPYVGPNDYLLAISEGDLRTEWGHAVRETAREILTAGEYAELELRGFIDKPTRRALTAQHGMSHFDSDLKYAVLGRAPAVHAITTGLARGGTFNGPTDGIPEVYLSSMQRSNQRPEYYSIDYANRFSYPSGFQIRHEAPTDGYDFVHQLLLEVGWSPELAKHYATKWVAEGATGKATTDPHVKKAQTTLFTEAHKAYVKNGISVAQVTPAFTALNIPADAQSEIVALWDVERTLAADVPPAA